MQIEITLEQFQGIAKMLEQGEPEVLIEYKVDLQHHHLHGMVIGTTPYHHFYLEIKPKEEKEHPP